MKQTISLLLAFFLSVSAKTQHDEDGDHHHDSIIHLGPIDILGDFNQSDLLNSVPTASTLHGKDLLKRSQNSLGETLSNEVGVNSSQFGPSASRPVIRGLEGDRIRILQNGIGVLDASGTSQDHAVPINTLTAESIEIVRGPINLLYGTSAIGGVINIVNSRIHKNYYPGFLGAFDLKSESVNQGQNIAGKFDYGFNNLMLHFDGHYVNAGNTQTPAGAIINSETEQHSLAFGATYFSSQKNYLGLSYSDFNNLYGAVSEVDVDIKLRQQRIDLSGYYKINGFFKAIRLKSAQSFYKHTELENGNTGTIFDNQGREIRLELIQNNSQRFSGILGLQTQMSTLSALGDEAFLPTTDTFNLALFAFEEMTLQNLKINAALRSEFSKLKSDDLNFFTAQQTNKFNTTSFALGSLYTLTNNISLGLNASVNERSPTYQELYAGGAHLAVGIYEQGDLNLKKEQSLAIEASVKQTSKKWTSLFTVFNQDFKNYISLSPTGTFDDTDESGTIGDSTEDFEIYNYQSQRARISGLEFESRYTINSNFNAQFQMDYLRGDNLDVQLPLPRISPTRLGLGLTYENKNWLSSIEWKHVLKQSRLSMNELKTPHYNLFNLNLNYKLNLNPENQLLLYGQVQNIFNDRAQNHVSLLKDQILLPGRNFILGLRILF